MRDICSALSALVSVTEKVPFSCSQSVKASFPPGAGTDLKIVKCTAILRRINELKQGFILSDSFQKCLLPDEVRHICLKYLLGQFLLCYCFFYSFKETC